MATTPETSYHTSIQYRINAARAGKTPQKLMPFAGYPRQNMPNGIPLRPTDYIELMGITGRQMARHKKGCIEDHELPVLEGLNIRPEQWQELTSSFEHCFFQAASSEAYLIKYQ